MVEPFEIVSVRFPNVTWLLRTPLSVVMVAPAVVADMRKVTTAVVTFTWLDDAMLPVPVSANVPPSMLVTPVYVFVPLSVCVPAASVSPPVPPMRPPYVDEPFEIVRVRLPNATWLLATPLSVATIAPDVVAEYRMCRPRSRH